MTVWLTNRLLKTRSLLSGNILFIIPPALLSAHYDQEKPPAFYLLAKLQKELYKTRFIANSSSYTTTELSKLLTSCLTTIENHLIKILEKFVGKPSETGSIKSQITSKTSRGEKNSTKRRHQRHHQRQPVEQLFPIQVVTS